MVEEEPKSVLVRERLDVCELDRARMSLMNPALIAQKMAERTIDENAKPLIEMTMKEGIETVWDRYEMQQPPCKYCETGISCSRCTMGPCRIILPHRIRGVCGADADLIVSRNLLDTIATGSAAHSDHGRDIVETLYLVGTGKTKDYGIADPDKLYLIAKEYGIETAGKSANDLAAAVGSAMLEEYGMVKNTLQFLKRAPKATRETWNKLGISPRGIDREVVDCMHRIQMGVGADYVNILLQGLRCSLSDGWGGSMMGTDVSDVLFGTPTIKSSRINLAVLKEDHVNIAVHGHNPVLSEMVVKAVADPELVALARKNGAKGINLVGLCCTGSELLMRKGVPMTGNHLNQELVITTGALEAMIVDYQCIFPSLPRTASCFHTLIISTSAKATIPGSYFFEFTPDKGFLTAKAIVRMAVENFRNRNPKRVLIPGTPVPLMTGFSNEAIKHALGGSFKPLIDLIAAGKIRGAVGIVGCNNPHVKHDYGHVTLSKALIQEKYPLCRDRLCSDCLGKSRASHAGSSGSRGRRSSGGLRIIKDSTRAPHGFLRGQLPYPRARGGTRECAQRPDPQTAHRRRSAGMVLAEGGLDRCVLRRVRGLYRAWRDAAYRRQPGRGLAPDRRPQRGGEREFCRGA